MLSKQTEQSNFDEELDTLESLLEENDKTIKTIQNQIEKDLIEKLVLLENI